MHILRQGLQACEAPYTVYIYTAQEDITSLAHAHPGVNCIYEA